MLFRSDSLFREGTITKILDSSIVIAEKKIFLRDFSWISFKRNAKKNIWGGIGVFAAEGLLFAASIITDGNKILSQTVQYTFIPAVIFGSYLIIKGIIKANRSDKFMLEDAWEISTIPPNR